MERNNDVEWNKVYKEFLKQYSVNYDIKDIDISKTKLINLSKYLRNNKRNVLADIVFISLIRKDLNERELKKINQGFNNKMVEEFINDRTKYNKFLKTKNKTKDEKNN